MNEVLRVLVIEDDEDDFLIARRLLAPAAKPAFEVHWQRTLEDGLKAVAEQTYDVILLDYYLGADLGLELFRKRKTSLPPVIVLTGRGERDVDLEVMKAGAVDFLNKQSLNSILLERSVRYAIERQRCQVALRALEEQLRHSQRLEAMGRLAGGVAHDFNNLLTVITSYSDLLLDDSGIEDSHRADIEEILGAAQRASELTSQLLVFARKTPVVEPKVIDLNDSVRRLASMLRRLIGEHIELRVDLASGPAAVVAGANQIDQLLINLAVNARDAMPDGGVITIYSRLIARGDGSGRVAARPSHVELCIADTGVGIEPEALSRIFEPFFTTKESGAGTGLGLATVRSIVEEAHGAIDVATTVGAGTTFTMTFPVRELEQPPDSSPEQEILKGRTGTVLLVEDETTLRQLMARVLRESGYKVLEAKDGVEAQAIATAAASLDVLVSDVGMPKLSGPAVAQRVIMAHPSVKVLLVSGYADDSAIALCDASGWAFLAKPFSNAALSAKVGEILASASGGHEAASAA